jgi:tetratricopeptide (TPR) repeat protein
MSDAGANNLALALHYLDIEQPRRALEMLDRSENDLDEPEYWLLRARALVGVERHAEAIAAASAGLRLDPDDVELLHVNAVAQTGIGDLAAAERSLLAALRIAAEHPVLLAQYALLVARAGQLEKARRLLDEAERLDPSQPVVSYARGVIAYLSGNDKEASKHADVMLADDPEESSALAFRGAVLAERGSTREARRHFEAAARLDPSDARVVRAARETRFATHPLLWPLLPLQRFGPAKVWLGWIALLGILLALGLDTVAGILGLVYLAFVVYSWTVGPLTVRWLRRRAR